MLKMPLKNGWFLVEWKISRKPWFPRFSLSIDIHWPTKYLHLFIGQNPKHFWWLRPSPAPTNCPKSGLDLTSRITWVTHRCWITGYARLCYTDVAWVGVSKPKSGAPGNFRMIRMIVERFFVERSASTLPHPRTISINPMVIGPVRESWAMAPPSQPVPTTNCPWPLGRKGALSNCCACMRTGSSYASGKIFSLRFISWRHWSKQSTANWSLHMVF